MRIGNVRLLSFTNVFTHLPTSSKQWEGYVMEPSSRVAAEEAAAAIVNCGDRLIVHDVTEKDVKRRPKPPFTTSTLQQEASSRLGFGSGRTMSAAQALYEGRGWGEGLITYMRTDGLHVSPAAVSELRHVATSEFGDEYVPSSPNVYKKVQKNAQEAHEAIRPTSAKVLPAAVGARLGVGSDKLVPKIKTKKLKYLIIQNAF